MVIRKERGAITALVAVCALVLFMLGVGFYLIGKVIGGGKELQNAVDAGNLNVVKRSLTEVTVDLNGDIEKKNFSDLVESNGEVSLRKYDEIVGRTLFMAQRAEKIGTAQAIENVRQVANAVQGGKKSNSLGGRLLAKLEKHDLHNRFFDDFALTNSIRMLSCGLSLGGQAGQPSAIGYRENEYDVGFVEGTSSIAVSPEEHPELEPFLSDIEVPGQDGFFFLKGYTDLTFFEDSDKPIKIQAPSINAGQHPHLISRNKFESSTSCPDPDNAVPPNAFKSVGFASVNGSEQEVTSISVGVVGAVSTLADDPGKGLFVRIENPAGVNIHVPAGSASVDNVVNHEMFGNIWFADNDVFTTDRELLDEWVAYNQSGRSGPRPSNEGIFGPDGSPASTAKLNHINSLGSSHYTEVPFSHGPCQSCNSNNLSGPGKIQRCADMLPVFNAAYGYELTGNLGDGSLIAVEKVKSDLILAYFESWGGDGGCRDINTSPAETGLRKFDHDRVYIAYPEGNPWRPEWSEPIVTRSEGVIQFSKPGTLKEYLEQIGDEIDGSRNKGKTASKLLDELKETLKEIDNGLTDKAFKKLVSDDKNKIDLDRTYFIYLDPSPNPITGERKLILTDERPPFGDPDVKPDGEAEKYTANYEIIGLSVNPVHEIGIHYMLFENVEGTGGSLVHPSLKGEDEAVWTPATGFNGLLGELVFHNRAVGSARFCSPN